MARRQMVTQETQGLLTTRSDLRRVRPRRNLTDAVLIATTCLALLSGFASPGRAQTGDSTSLPPLSSRTIPLVTQIALLPDPSTGPERVAELKRWMDDFRQWVEWSSKWSNRRERGWFTSSRDRRRKPMPPAWLPARCETLIDDAQPLSSACTLLAEWRKDEAGRPIPSPRAVSAANKEDKSRTIWWEHIHADVLWPAMQWQASVYGVAGMHVATTVKGRLQVFIAPGAMVLNLPARNGSRAWKIAANYGIGYRLFDFAFPGGRPATLHVNLAKAWLLSDITDVVAGRTTDFVGLSISFKKSR